jgi:hypothetical protein
VHAFQFLRSILNLKSAPSNMKHLGLSVYLQRSKRKCFEDISENIQRKISGWKAKVLSYEGRNTLIRSVAASILS